MSLTDALARSNAKQPRQPAERIYYDGVNYAWPVNIPDSWHACDTCGRMAVYGTNYGNGRSGPARWCHDCYMTHATRVRAEADDYTNQIGDPAPPVDQTYGDTHE